MPPRHGLTAEYFSWSKPKETTRPICPPSQSGNRSIFVAQTSPARCVSEREKGGNFAPEDSKGRSPWRAFGDFPRDGKVTRGGGAERPLMGVWGPPAPTSGSAEGQRPSRRSLRGGGAERPPGGGRSQVWRLAPEGAQPLARAFSKTAAAPAVPAGRPPPPEQSG